MLHPVVYAQLVKALEKNAADKEKKDKYPNINPSYLKALPPAWGSMLHDAGGAVAGSEMAGEDPGFNMKHPFWGTALGSLGGGAVGAGVGGVAGGKDAVMPGYVVGALAGATASIIARIHTTKNIKERLESGEIKPKSPKDSDEVRTLAERNKNLAFLGNAFSGNGPFYQGVGEMARAVKKGKGEEGSSLGDWATAGGGYTTIPLGGLAARKGVDAARAALGKK